MTDTFAAPPATAPQGPYAPPGYASTPSTPPGPHEGSTAVGVAILGSGVELMFADGRTRALRYDFYSMLAIEEEHGSIKGLLDKVQPPAPAPGVKPGPFDSLGSPIMSVVCDLIRFGLYDAERQRHLTQKECAQLMVPSMIGEYVEVASAAIAQAFGPETPADHSGAPGSRPDPTTGSTGSAGGGSP